MDPSIDVSYDSSCEQGTSSPITTAPTPTCEDTVTSAERKNYNAVLYILE